MNIVTCVATYTGDRILDFIRNLATCYEKGKTLVLLTGDIDIHWSFFDEAMMVTDPIFHKIESRPRLYAEIMKEKFKLCEQYCDDDSIVFLTDDDYFINPYAFKVMKKVFTENEEVNYLSLLKGVGLLPKEEDIHNLSGFHFVKTFSCMGGSLVVRWKVFKEHVVEFFDKYGIDGMFDHDFFVFLSEKLCSGELVYTLYDFSLYQQCNLISHYLAAKGPGGTRVHSYGEAFDPRCNPFQTLGIEEH